MVDAENLIIAFVILVAYLSISLLTGSVIFYGAKKKQPFFSKDLSSIFIRSFFGSVFLISGYASIVTGFQSSLLPLPILILIFASLHPDPGKQYPEKMQKKALMYFIILAPLIYTFYSGLYFTSDEKNYVYLGSDIQFYARAADYLNYKGNENVTLDYTGTGAYVEPYHYGDLWNTAIFSGIPGIFPITALIFISYGSFFSLFTIGLAAYFNSFSSGILKGNIYILVLVASLLSGFAFLYPSFLLESTIFSISLLYLPKLFFPGCIILALLITLKRRNWNQIFLITTIGAIFFVNIAPTIIFSVGLIFFISSLRDKLILKQISLPIILSCIASFIYYFLFYYLNDKVQTDLVLNSFSLQTSINIFSGGLLQFLPLMPFVFLLLLTKIKMPGALYALPPDLLFVLLTPICGLICWSALYPLTSESVQFFSNVFIVITVIAIARIIYYLFNFRNIWIRMAAIMMFIITIGLNAWQILGSEKISRSDYKRTQQFLHKNGLGFFVNLRDLSKINPVKAKKTNMYPPLEFITYIDPRYVNVSLNTKDINADSTSVYEKNQINLQEVSSFYTFIKRNPVNLLPDEYARRFIRENKIRYLTIELNYELPGYFKPLIIDSLILSNGWNIYYLEQDRINNLPKQ